MQHFDPCLLLRSRSNDLSQLLNKILLLRTFEAHHSSVPQKVLEPTHTQLSKVGVGANIDHLGALPATLEVLQETTERLCLEGSRVEDGG